ncbi:hypothetical protein TcCL_NonESM10797 [Trypanosoma cruzi]|nr:hypothetical protein TcCL_NonESM10797 [Trypanosoma cruzi]
MFVVTLLHGTGTHTRSACIPPCCVRPPPEWPHTRAAANSFHPRRSKINTDIPRHAKISVASTGLLPLCHRRRNTAQCTHLFSSCAVSRLLHTFSDGLTPTKARHKSHCDRTSSCDERLRVCMDPLLTRAGRQPAAAALVPVHRLQHGKEKTANSSCTYSHQQHQHAGRQPSFLSTSRNAEK